MINKFVGPDEPDQWLIDSWPKYLFVLGLLIFGTIGLLFLFFYLVRITS